MLEELRLNPRAPRARSGVALWASPRAPRADLVDPSLSTGFAESLRMGCTASPSPIHSRRRHQGEEVMG